MKRKLLAAVLALSLTGCSTAQGLFDGATGAPIEQTDSKTAYHVGQIIIPVISGIVAVIRRAVLGLP